MLVNEILNRSNLMRLAKYLAKIHHLLLIGGIGLLILSFLFKEVSTSPRTILTISGILVEFVVYFRDRYSKDKSEHKRQINETVLRYLLIKVSDLLEVLTKNMHNVYWGPDGFYARTIPEFVDARDPKQVELLSKFHPIFDPILYKDVKMKHYKTLINNLEQFEKEMDTFNTNCLNYVKNLYARLIRFLENNGNIKKSTLNFQWLTLHAYKKLMSFRFARNLIITSGSGGMKRLEESSENRICAEGPEGELETVKILMKKFLSQEATQRNNDLLEAEKLLTQASEIRDNLAIAERRTDLPGRCEYC